MIYFTSDLHLGHENVLKHCNRPFKTIDEMNETLIKTWNSQVKDHDTVYILGDLCFRMNKEETYYLIKRLKGHKILIKGNHDIKYDENLFDEIYNFKIIKYNHIKFILMHYPLLEWPHQFHGGIHLHGHQHNLPEYNQLMKEKNIRRYDVGVDANDFRLVSIDEILDFFEIR